MSAKNQPIKNIMTKNSLYRDLYYHLNNYIKKIKDFVTQILFLEKSLVHLLQIISYHMFQNKLIKVNLLVSLIILLMLVWEIKVLIIYQQIFFIINNFLKAINLFLNKQKISLEVMHFYLATHFTLGNNGQKLATETQANFIKYKSEKMLPYIKKENKDNFSLGLDNKFNPATTYAR